MGIFISAWGTPVHSRIRKATGKTSECCWVKCCVSMWTIVTMIWLTEYPPIIHFVGGQTHGLKFGGMVFASRGGSALIPSLGIFGSATWVRIESRRLRLCGEA